MNLYCNKLFALKLIKIEDNFADTLSYSSLNQEIATVDEDGDVLGLREGTTWVKVIDTETGKVNVIYKIIKV